MKPNKCPFSPPFPKPHKSKAGYLARFFFTWNSWIHTLFEKSYTMKMGEVKLPYVDFYIANEKSLVKQVMDDREGNYPKHKILHEMLAPLIGNSIFAINGEAWKDQRSMVNTAFTHANLKRIFSTMQDSVNNLINVIEQRDLSKPLHIDPLMTYITADIIFRTSMSTPLSEQDAYKIHNSFYRFQKYAQRAITLKMYKLPSFGNRRKSISFANKIHEVFFPIVKARYDLYWSDPDKYSQQNNDILDALLRAKHPKTGEHFDLQGLVDEMAMTFLAGHETTASALTWTLYLIAKCPDLQKELVEEISMVAGNDTINFNNIRKLEKLLATFKESLRLYPPVSFFMRETAKDTKARNKEMKKGSLLVVSPWLIQRNENYWEEPHSFNPCRFASGGEAEGNRDAYMPFGKGERICIGAAFAQQESLLVLSQILQKFNIEMGGKEPEPISRMTTRPKDGVHLKFSLR